MTIKNKKICSRLEDDEEIIGIANKPKKHLHTPYLLFLPIGALGKFIEHYPAIAILLFILFSVMPILLAIDCFFTEIITTNKKIFISRLNRLISLNYEDIECIRTIHHSIWILKYSPCSTFIYSKLKKKPYIIYCTEIDTLKEKIKEIVQNYDDQEAIERLEAEDDKFFIIWIFTIQFTILLIVIANVLT